MSKLLLKVEEAAELMSVGRSKAYELIRTGELPHLRIGRSVRVPVGPLEKWINERAADAANANGSEEERGVVGTGRPERI
jgi:excisionase family DNA binding protein